MRLMIPYLMSVAALNAQVPNQPVMRDAATHSQLVARARQASQSDPMAKLEPSTGGDPSKGERIPDLVASSDVLCFGGRATLVPKRAILRVPPAIADRLKLQSGAKLQIWSEFLIANRGWVVTHEVTRAEAEGNQKISEEVIKRIMESDKLVVATYMGGPISVLPPKEPAPAANITSQTNSKP